MVVAVGVPTIVSAHHKRVTFGLAANGAAGLADFSEVSDFADYDYAWLLFTPNSGGPVDPAISIALAFPEVSATQTVTLNEGTSPGNELFIRQPSDTSVGLIMPVPPKLVFRNLHTVAGALTVILGRRAVVDLLHRKNFDPNS